VRNYNCHFPEKKEVFGAPLHLMLASYKIINIRKKCRIKPLEPIKFVLEKKSTKFQERKVSMVCRPAGFVLDVHTERTTHNIKIETNVKKWTSKT
jgi:hypothetical protein